MPCGDLESSVTTSTQTAVLRASGSSTTARAWSAANAVSGVIELTEQERLSQNLDRLYPNARRRQIVEFEGKCYQRVFSPLEKSRSDKSVKVWGREWLLADE